MPWVWFCDATMEAESGTLAYELSFVIFLFAFLTFAFFFFFLCFFFFGGIGKH